MNGRTQKAPMWVQMMMLALFAVFGQGCGAQVIARASGRAVDTTRLQRATHLPVREATSAERSAFEQSLVLTARANGYCLTTGEIDEAGFNACRAELLNRGPYLTFACLAGCNDSGLRQVCLEHRLPTTLDSRHATQDGRSAFGQTYTCAQAVELVMREHSLELAEMNRRRVDEDERAQVQLANLRRERDEARSALAARQGGAAPTAQADSAPLADAPNAVDRGDATHHAAARHVRHQHRGGRRTLRADHATPRGVVARPARRVRRRRERSDYVTLAEAQQIATRAVADALHQLNICAGIGMRDAQAGIAACMTRVNGYTVVTQALVANQCPSVRPSDVNAMLACGQQIADRLADRADAGVTRRAIATDGGTPRARVTSPPRDAPSSSADPPPHAATDQSLRKGVKYGVIGLVLLIGVLGLLRILLPGTSGPGG